MNTQEFHTSHPFLTSAYDNAEHADHVSVPYAGQTRMRLTIASGMADARIRIDPEATSLIAVDHGEGISPRLRVSPSDLRLSWPTTIGSWLRSALNGEDHDLEILLHPAVEWSLEIRGGLSRFEADLAPGKLDKIEISGGVSGARFDLPAATGVVPIRISGGVSDFALRRPAETGVAVAVRGGISGLRLDEQAFEAIGGHARLVSGAVLGDSPRYTLEVSGGACDLDVVAR